MMNDFIKLKAEELLKRAKLPEDPIVAGNRKDIFLKGLESYRYEGDVILSPDGFEVTDAHGWPLTPDQFVRVQFNKYFDLSDLPISETECIARLKDPKITPAERKIITERWERLRKHIQ